MNIFDSKIDAHQVVNKLNIEIQKRLIQKLNSIFVYGSFARGKFDKKKSDINLLLVINELNFSARFVASEVCSKIDRLSPPSFMTEVVYLLRFEKRSENV